jgi:trehalose 6-phosphate synthase/phosphatase
MRILIISNRAPVSITQEGDEIRYSESSGGLASGLRAYIESQRQSNPDVEILWIGWPGAEVQDQNKVRNEILNRFGTYSVFLSTELMTKFYEGFCNSTIWPLFHYFPMFTEYNRENWNNYVDVNRIYCDNILNVYKPGDIIWIHDYHLMLVPGMLRETLPDASIGFFLHIPFPSYEIFRLLPSEWRMKILKGILGADLIGFHTHDYRTYFLKSILRILGVSNYMGEIEYFDRNIKVDSFPMGIDFEKYSKAVESDPVKKEIEILRSSFGDKRIILSLDRQDYSKGILNRLKGYEYFLNNHPEWKEKVLMVMILIPSRVGVDDYADIKSQIDELAGRINGTFGTLKKMPILYQYRSVSFTELISLYVISDVSLVTPLRDGMNLVAKEFVACKTEGKGVLILSEMAGASDELSESIIINPNNVEEIGEAINAALLLDLDDQRARLNNMRKRLKDCDIFKWASGFLKNLKNQKMKQLRLATRVLPENVRNEILTNFSNAVSRVIFLDYDGTIQPFSQTPELAVPSKRVMALLNDLGNLENTELILISGRDKQTVEKWFGHLNISLVAEHGLLIKEKYNTWQMLKPVNRRWKKKIISLMENFVEKLPGSLLEEKDFSVAFHYRRCDPELAALRVRELFNHLTNFTNNLEVQVMQGNKVIEVRCQGIDKGVAVMHWLTKKNSFNEFILAIGDDVTDEDMFKVIPQSGYSLKVGKGVSHAMYNLHTPEDALQLLSELLIHTTKQEIIRAIH